MTFGIIHWMYITRKEVETLENKLIEWNRKIGRIGITKKMESNVDPIDNEWKRRQHGIT